MGGDWIMPRRPSKGLRRLPFLMPSDPSLDKAARLQRGGSQVLLGMLPGTVPFIPPTYLLAPDPGRPVLKGGILLFPDGFGGGSIAEGVGEHDPCTETATPDTILF